MNIFRIFRRVNGIAAGLEGSLRRIFHASGAIRLTACRFITRAIGISAMSHQKI
jgi:hypothetical protein